MDFTELKRSNLETKVKTYFRMAEEWAKRATCPRASVGCVLVSSSGFVISSGYNGSPEGQPTCFDAGCILEGGHCVRAVHAEMRAITYAARRGMVLDRAEAFTTLLPCIQCLHALYLAGVQIIHYDQSYVRSEASQVHLLARRANVQLIERVRG